MGSQRLAAVAAVSHARIYFNHTQPDVSQSQATQQSVNIFFVSATLCGVLVAVCAACWRRSPAFDKPEEIPRSVYTVSADVRLDQNQDPITGPPPAYDTLVEDVSIKNCAPLEQVIVEPCSCGRPGRSDSGLPSYEAAVMLRDSKS